MANAADLAAEKAVLTQRVALSMKTVADQQHIIAGLQALVDALKARVQELEAARERDTSARTSATAPAPCALTHTATLTEVERLRGQNSRLRQAVADLQLQRESLTSAQRTTASQLETLTQTVLSQQSDLTRLRTQEALWEKEKAMLLLTQTQRQQVESEAMILRDDADFERQIKTKWRALALTIAERLDEGWQTQLQSRFFTLAEEERRYRERRDARVHLSPVLPRRSLTAPASERRTAPSVQPALPTPSQAALSLWSRTAASRTDDDR